MARSTMDFAQQNTERASDWMRAIGMRVWVDAAGNLHGLLGKAGRRLVIASHLDTVPDAGAFDGILGVVLGVAVAEEARDLQNLSLEELTRRLAVYIGPVAKFVVKKLAAQSDDMEFIAREAAKQIPSETDRTAFLRSKMDHA